VNRGFWRETLGVGVEGEPVGLELGLELGLDDGVGLGPGILALARGNLGMWVGGGRGSIGIGRVVVVHRHWGISEKLYQ